MTRHENESVAVVGMSVLLPGASGLDAYWHNLVSGVDSVVDIPADRWDTSEFLSSVPTRRADQVSARRGGFITEDVTFDPIQYGVMPASVAGCEPEQLIALRVASEAIEDAGGMDRLPDNDRVAVVLGRCGQGVAGANWFLRVRLGLQVKQLLDDLMPELAPGRAEQVRQSINDSFGAFSPENAIGLMPNLTASRISNRLNLHGPAYILDAACASSLLAVDHAVRDLLSGRVDAVLAGGVHHMQDVSFWSVFNQLGAVSEKQSIRPFDAAADGLLLGEGTGVVVLKRLSDAMRAGDRIHAVVLGTGTASDGRSGSLLNPESAGQVMAIRRAWAAAGLDPAGPDSIGLLEAHGTATPTGDLAELASLAEVFGDRENGGVLGSVKSMIGHTIATAGIAGFIKAVLAVSKGVQLPTLNCDDPHAHIERTRFRPLRSAREWNSTGPRRAAVNAFGFGGINCHVVIQEAPSGRANRVALPAAAGLPSNTEGVSSPYEAVEPVLLLAAPDPSTLAHLLEQNGASLRARCGRPGDHPAASDRTRLAVVNPTDDRLDLARRIVARGASSRGARDIWFSPRGLAIGEGDAGVGRIAFLFPGLEADFEPRVADVAERLNLLPRDPRGSGQRGRIVDLLGTGLLLHDALRRIGIVPDLMAGHSVGEWAAGIAAGVTDRSVLDDLAAELDDSDLEIAGLMPLVVGTGVDGISGLLSEYPGVVLAQDNSPAQCVVCGPDDEISRLGDRLRQRNVLSQTFPLRIAYHTRYFEASVRALRESMDRRGTPMTAPEVPLWSATVAGPAPLDMDRARELFYRQLAEPVRFGPMIRQMHKQGVRIFVQVGPGHLSSLVQDNLRDLDHLSIAANSPHRSGLDQLRRVAYALWVEGARPDLAVLGVPARPDVRTTNRPSMPIKVDLSGPGTRIRSRAEDHGATAAKATPSEGAVVRKALAVSVGAMPYLMDHCFFPQPSDWPYDKDRRPVLPAATSLHHLIEAVHGVRPDRPVVRVDDVAFTRWVVAAPAQTLELSLQAIGSDQYRALLGRAVRADISLADDYPTGPVEWSEALVSERPPKVPVAEMYGGTKLFHGPNFQGVAEVLAEGDRHIRARLRCLDAPGSLLDAAFQLVGNWLDSTHSSRTVMYPVAIANVSFFGPHPSPGALLECTARIASVDDQHVSADLQLSRAGVAWAVLRGTRFRRFDSNPRSRAMETHPAKNAASIRQPEGWVLLEDCWPDWHSAGFIANLILGQDGYEEYRKKPPALRRQWLLGRCAAKDAVRYEAWATGITEIFPIEVQVYNDETGRPHVKGWPGRPFLDCDVSISHTGPFAVALARPGESSGPDSVGVGIDIALIAEHPPATLRLALTKAEDQLLNELSLGDPQGRIEWFTRFWAAKESVAKAMGTGLRGNPRQFVVSEVSPAFLTVKARARVFTVGYRTIEDSEQSSRFVVAWTYGEKHEKQPRDDRAAGAQSQPDSPAEEGML